MDPPPRPLDGDPEVALVDHLLYGLEGALASYVVDADRPALFDAGGANTVDRVLDALDHLGVDPGAVEYVLVSHLHLDHAGGAGRLAEACPEATVVLHERGAEYLTDPEQLARLVDSVAAAVGEPEPFGDPDPVDPDRVRTVGGGERLDLGDRVLDVIDAPGHAPHHYACHDPDRGTLFAADAAGAYDPVAGEPAPSTPPPSFDLAANLDTVARLRELAPERVLYSHFGPVADPGVLAAYANLLPEWVETVERAREATDGSVEAVVDRLTPEWESPTLARDVAGVFDYLD